MLRSALLACFATICTIAPAQPASFDCARAASEHEQAICSDPTLSDSDSQVSALYAAAVALLSADGAKLLEEGQLGWQKFLADACPAGMPRPAAVHCLSKMYRQRIRDFRQIAIRKGPFLFNRVDHYGVSQLDRPVDGFDTDLVTHHSSTPRIDQPVTPITTRWNQINARPDNGSETDCGAGDGDTWLDYQIGFASAHLISIQWVTSFYCPGTPHGYDSFETETLLLSPDPRPLQPDDIFRADAPWRQHLAELVGEKVQAAADAEHVDIGEGAKHVAGDLAVDPKDWIINENGIEIAFAPYVLRLGRGFHPDITVPWTALRDVMIANPPVP